MSELHLISNLQERKAADWQADVVFIHGLGGDAFETWRHGEDASTSWPHWLAEERPDVAVWSLGYAASPSKWFRLTGWFLNWFRVRRRDQGHAMALPDRAVEVLERMVQKGLGQRPLCLIGHSLGGLLAKQILRTSSDERNPKKKRVYESTRAVLFLATPHSGAELATFLDAFRKILGTTVSLEELRENHARLAELYNWYRNHSAGIRTATFYEHRATGVITVVDRGSAHPGVGEDPIPAEENHISIAKPRKPDEPVCDKARELLRDYVLREPAPTPAKEPAPTVAAAPAPVQVKVRVEVNGAPEARTQRAPCELPPAAEQFFGRSKELDQLTARLRDGKNAAVVGMAGLGKTALAAEAVRRVVGKTGDRLPNSPFPDGVVFLDLYTYHGMAEPVWSALANKLAGPEFLERKPVRERATEACRGRRLLIILEGGEEADGTEGRTHWAELRSALSPENRWLLLTREQGQAVPSETVALRDKLDADDAGKLLDSLTGGRMHGGVRTRVLELLEGHPLALTWAGGFLAREEENPEALARDWAAQGLLSLSDPTQAEHTLKWLFRRSTRGLDETASAALTAAGLLAHEAFPQAAVLAALGGTRREEAARKALQTLARRGLLRRNEDDTWRFTHVLGYQFARKETGADPELQERLAEWLRGLLGTDGNLTVEAAAQFRRAIRHATALLRTDADHRLAASLGAELLDRVWYKCLEGGQSDELQTILFAGVAWHDRLPCTKVDEGVWLSQRALLCTRQGELDRVRGDVKGSLAAYRRGMRLAKSLVEKDQGNLEWRWNLSACYLGLGEALVASGNLRGAEAACRRAVQIRGGVAEAHASDAREQMGFSLSLRLLGRTMLTQGDLLGALGVFRQALERAKAAAELDGNNVTLQRGVASCHELLAEVFEAQSDYESALDSLQAAEVVAQALAVANPNNNLLQHDLATNYLRVGHVLCVLGNLDGALEKHRQALQLRNQLLESNPLHAGLLWSQSVTHEKIGDVLMAQGDLDGAAESYRRSLGIRERLTQVDLSNAEWQRGLAISHNKLADVLRVQNRLAGSLSAYREALTIQRRLAEKDAANTEWRRDLSVTLTGMAQLQGAAGDYTQALQHAEESLAIDVELAALDPTNGTSQRDVEVTRTLVTHIRQLQTTQAFPFGRLYPRLENGPTRSLAIRLRPIMVENATERICQHSPEKRHHDDLHDLELLRALGRERLTVEETRSVLTFALQPVQDGDAPSYVRHNARALASKLAIQCPAFPWLDQCLRVRAWVETRHPSELTLGDHWLIALAALTGAAQDAEAVMSAYQDLSDRRVLAGSMAEHATLNLAEGLRTAVVCAHEINAVDCLNAQRVATLLGWLDLGYEIDRESGASQLRLLLVCCNLVNMAKAWRTHRLADEVCQLAKAKVREARARISRPRILKLMDQLQELGDDGTVPPWHYEAVYMHDDDVWKTREPRADLLLGIYEAAVTERNRIEYAELGWESWRQYFASLGSMAGVSKRLDEIVRRALAVSKPPVSGSS